MELLMQPTIWFFAFLLLVVVSYIILLLCFMRGWKQISVSEPLIEFNLPTPNITVIIACKNEVAHLPALLNSLEKQTFSPSEIILIDDHSEDETFRILQNYAVLHTNVSVFKATGKGKKAALSEGIVLAVNAELILCTDADCVVNTTWVETVAAAYQQEKYDMLILPVKMVGKSFFARLQAMEFASLIASGAAMDALHRPIMCNGANLAFTRNAWLESRNELHPELKSGDDIFLLHSMKRRKKSIRFLKSKNALVETSASPSLTAFFRQRARWISKAGSYTDADTIAVAFIVGGMNFCMLVLLAGACFSFQWQIVFLCVFLLKWVLDGWFLQETKTFFGLKQVFGYSFILSVFYPFYVLISFLKGLKI